MNKRLLIILIQIMLIISCGIISNGNVDEDTLQDEFALTKSSLFHCEVMAMSPGDVSKVKVHNISRTKSLVKTQIEGIQDFVVRRQGTRDEYYKIKGIDLIVTLECSIIDGKESKSIITDIKGEFKISRVFGSDVYEWYSTSLNKSAEEECTSTSDCSGYPSIPGLLILCINNKCTWVKLE